MRKKFHCKNQEEEEKRKQFKSIYRNSHFFVIFKIYIQRQRVSRIMMEKWEICIYENCEAQSYIVYFFLILFCSCTLNKKLFIFLFFFTLLFIQLFYMNRRRKKRLFGMFGFFSLLGRSTLSCVYDDDVGLLTNSVFCAFSRQTEFNGFKWYRLLFVVGGGEKKYYFFDKRFNLKKKINKKIFCVRKKIRSEFIAVAICKLYEKEWKNIFVQVS